jgi:hypothetical protein
MPVYYIVGRWEHNPAAYALYHIVKVVEGVFTPEEYQHVWNTYVQPFTQEGNYQIFTFIREPDNPFRKEHKP